MTHATIVIVDDDREEHLILKELFTEQNFHSVLFFDDGPSVLAYLASLTNETLFPKLIISDINMPEMSGMELLQKIKSNVRYKEIKVLMLSTANKREYAEECQRLGAQEFVQKPDTFLEMKQLVGYITDLPTGLQLPPYKKAVIRVNI